MIYIDDGKHLYRSATLADATIISPDMRVADVMEVWQASAVRPYYALAMSIAVSDEAVTFCREGRPVGCFGVKRESMWEATATLWLLATPEFSKMRHAFARYHRQFLLRYLERYDILSNYIYHENVASLRLVKMMGARFEEPKPHGAFNAPFIRFEIRRSDHV